MVRSDEHLGQNHEPKQRKCSVHPSPAGLGDLPDAGQISTEDALAQAASGCWQTFALCNRVVPQGMAEGISSCPVDPVAGSDLDQRFLRSRSYVPVDWRDTGCK